VEVLRVKAFDYQAPETLDGAAALLAQHKERARVLAGGTDLLVQLRAGRYEVDVVVDVKRVPELNQVTFDSAAGLSIGAAVPCWRVAEDPEVRGRYPGLVDAISIIGGTGIQGRATLGGNLGNASPSADSTPSLIVHGASVEIVGQLGRRTLPVEQFCLAPGRSALQPGELIVAVRVPVPQKGFGARYLRFIPRNEMDIAVVGVGAAVRLGADGKTVEWASIALGAVGPTPIVAGEAAAALVGQAASTEAFARAADAAKAAARPITDVRGTASQRRHLVGVLTRRALEGALTRARGEPLGHPVAGAASANGHGRK
jgi:CO/xanthine dehydrogenase FAD-binding subunit